MTSSAPRSTSNAVRSRTSAGHAATIAGAPIKPGFPSSRRTIPLRARAEAAPAWPKRELRRSVAGSTNGHRVACRRTVSGLGTEAREAATERAVLRMVALGVLAAQAARFRYADGWLRRLLSGFTELARRRL